MHSNEQQSPAPKLDINLADLEEAAEPGAYCDYIVVTGSGKVDLLTH